MAQPASNPNLPDGEMGLDYNAFDSNEERHGPWIRVWPNGKLYYEGQFNHGRPQGSFTFYFETGEVMSRIEHEDDPRYMIATHYRQDGNVSGSGGYFTTEELDEAGEPIRVKDKHWKYFDVRGTLRIEEHWSNGVLQGEYAAYDENGRVVERGFYENGEKSGPWSIFNERGKILNRVEFQAGLHHGEFQMNDDLGRNLIIGRHAHGQAIGAWVHYNSDRTVHVVRKYENGELVMERYENGLQEQFFKDERPELQMNWENGKRHGAFKEWHDNGHWIVVDQIDPSTGETESRLEIQGQSVAREGTYFEGELHGTVITYSPEGRLLTRESYDHGNLVE